MGLVVLGQCTIIPIQIAQVALSYTMLKFEIFGIMSHVQWKTWIATKYQSRMEARTRAGAGHVLDYDDSPVLALGTAHPHLTEV
jgi:hypothetical protein